MRVLAQVFAVTVSSLLTVMLGASVGYVTILIPSLTDPNEEIRINEVQTSWISSVELIASLVGSTLSGIVTEPLGRKVSMMMLTIPSLISWVLFHFADEKWQIFVALTLQGVTSGLIEAPILSYVAEVTEPHLRGTLSATVLVSGSFGYFVEFLIGSLLHWKLAALVSAAVPIVAFCLLSQVPETPYWLLSRNKEDEARRSLAWLRGWTTIASIENEFQNIRKSFENHENNGVASSCVRRTKQFARKNFVWPFTLVSLLFAWSNFVGVGTLTYYAAIISVTLKSPIDKYLVTVLIGLCQFLGSLVCIFTVSFFGKRITALFAASSLCVTTGAIGLYAHLLGVVRLNFASIASEDHTDDFAWFTVVLLCCYGFISYCGIRSIPWILTGEVFSNETRAVACGLSTSVNYFTGFVANKVYLSMISILTLAGVYWTYATICFLGFVVIYLAVPETEGRTLEEIVNHFNGKGKLSNKMKLSTSL
ncbi:hypothetical protein PPYR_09537 [Photinus pyralis]|uniref:Major facilitator superfamily (MFS) profile domain-containing protein n=1 Tax=Photinus pyralis TaxID=7054 RepID=A0A5N4AMK6_PHOPY|nr:hypothetical protein PPYR_09537 [Photinus pyralis]